MFFSQLNYDHLSIDNFNGFAPEFGMCLKKGSEYMFVQSRVVLNCKQSCNKFCFCLQVQNLEEDHQFFSEATKKMFPLILKMSSQVSTYIVFHCVFNSC